MDFALCNCIKILVPQTNYDRGIIIATNIKLKHSGVNNLRLAIK